MHPAIRPVLAVLCGVAVSFTLAAGIETVGHLVYPTATEIDLSQPEQLRTFIDSLPVGALVFVLAAWVIATFVGGIVAGFIARPQAFVASCVVGAFVLAATIATLVMIPHPTWMAVCGIAGIALAGLIAGKLMSSSTRREP